MYDSHFVKKPNLPENRVITAIISERYDWLFPELTKLGVSVIASPPTAGIIGAEKYHADISALPLGDDRIICARNNPKLAEILRGIGMRVTLSERYITGGCPTCTGLNALITDRGVLCRKGFADPALLDACGDMLPIINVKQSYTRCSTAIVSDNAVITADESIYHACVKSGIDVLKISNGGIAIEDYDCGFIGGACGKLSRDILAFCGKIEDHADYRNMKAFALNYGVNLLSLSNRPLFDVGGILAVATAGHAPHGAMNK